jgi:hypothetical protein
MEIIAWFDLKRRKPFFVLQNHINQPLSLLISIKIKNKIPFVLEHAGSQRQTLNALGEEPARSVGKTYKDLVLNILYPPIYDKLVWIVVKEGCRREVKQ